MRNLRNDCSEVLFSAEEIQARIKQIAVQIAKEYKGVNTCPFVIGILKGCLHFYSDLTREFTFPHTSGFMSVSTYGGGTESTGKLEITQPLSGSVLGKDVLIVEDIIDSGITLSMLKELFLQQGATSVSIVTLLNKPSGRKFDIEPDYYCFEVGNQFVVGYGLDYQEKYRNLPFVGILKEEIYKEQN